MKAGRLAAPFLAVHAALLLAAAAPSGSLLSPLAPMRKGPTFDEYFYVASGVSYLETGDFNWNREHPPLAKMLSALPLVAAPGLDFPAQWNDLLHYPQQFFYGHNADRLARNVFLARLPFVALALALDAALFAVALSIAGRAAAFTSLGLAVFDPNLLSAAPTANLDFPSAAFGFLALAAVRRSIALPGARSTLLAALAVGAALLTKLTALLLAPAIALLASVSAIAS
ncbi:MAG TPA: phospholipid carrier-dependent glycosyltransferase, partial [Planctomycetota bacterium]|nr:phospholipid carrier-dependent glycosyltransferase [Planctomycetota bacterium]